MQKLFNAIKFISALIGFAVLTGCGGGGGDSAPTPLTNVEKIARVWRISQATENNQPATFNFTSFRVSFSNSSATGGNYTITPQNDVPRPDYNNVSSTTGSWALNGNTITLTHGTTTSTISVDLASLSETNCVISWQLPLPSNENPGGDKTQPSYRYTLVPAN